MIYAERRPWKAIEHFVQFNSMLRRAGRLVILKCVDSRVLIKLIGLEGFTMRFAVRQFACLGALIGLVTYVGCGGPGAPTSGASAPSVEAEDAALAPEAEAGEVAPAAGDTPTADTTTGDAAPSTGETPAADAPAADAPAADAPAEEAAPKKE
ncbi:MAG: hypothetical protein CMJ64_14165 [Planctomycetaceae bacterium]|nr:hypothetical protein [Planctomycetaceae bacterium]